jgi:phage replication initiation protein
LSGQGCREFDASSGRWRDLFNKVIEVGGRFSRIDVAIDDHDGHFSLDDVHEKMKRREVRSCFRKGRNIDNYDFTDKSVKVGKTLYFGSPNSETQIKFYDKAAEHDSNHGHQHPVLPERC